MSLLPGETILPQVQTNDAAMTLTGNGTEQYTRIQIQEIG